MNSNFEIEEKKKLKKDNLIIHQINTFNSISQYINELNLEHISK